MSLTVRTSVAGLLTAAALLLAGAASANAELRTAHYQNLNPTSTGSATDPQVQSVLLDYASSGTLTARLRFFHALADPSQTSALHDAYAFVELGDSYGGDGLPDCERGKYGIYLTVNVGDGTATVSYSLGSAPLDLHPQVTFTPDRSELDVTVDSPLFARMNLICWDVTAQNQADTSDPNGFDSGFRLMDGFTPQDGDLPYVGNEDLNSEADYVNNNLGHPHNPLFIRGIPFHCRLGVVGVRCRGKQRMPSIIGKPTLFVSGTQFFTTRTVPGGEEELVWHHDEHATLGWARCPSAIHPPTRLIGHPCHTTVHWTGTRDLYRML